MKKSLNLWIIIGIVFTAIVLLLVPLVVTTVNKVSLNNGTIMPNNFIEGTIIMIYAVGIPYFWGLLELRKICKIITSDNPFDERVSKSFKKLAYISLSIGGIILIENIVMTKIFKIYLYALQIIPSFVLIFLSIFAYFMLMVFSKIFMQAYNIKKENDLVV